MAQHLIELDLVPQLVLASDATRARATAEIFCEQWSAHSVEVMFLGELYLAEPNAYLEAIETYSAGQQRIMVVGHNPGLENLILQLTAEDEIMPTAAIAQVSFEKASDWKTQSLDGLGRLVNVYRPKELQ